MFDDVDVMWIKNKNKYGKKCNEQTKIVRAQSAVKMSNKKLIQIK